jgi:hypothetical protein
MKLCNGTRDPQNQPDSLENSLSLAAAAVHDRVRECFHRPSDTNLILTAINVILKGYGVEGVPYDEDAIHDGSFIDYVNFGDTYAITVLFNPKTGKFEIGNWGSLYEKSPAYQATTEEEAV